MEKGWLKTVCIILISLGIALTLGFIFGSSSLSQSSSNDQSSGVFEPVQGALDSIFGVGKIDAYIFRKIAHFVEFCFLAIEICTLLVILKRFNAKLLFTVLFVGLLVAVIDETIQNYTGRVSSVIDALIDFGGYAFGTLVVYVGHCFNILIKRRKAVKSNK